MGNQEVVQINFGVAVVSRTIGRRLQTRWGRHSGRVKRLSEGTGCNKALDIDPIVRKVNFNTRARFWIYSARDGVQCPSQTFKFLLSLT